MKIVYWFILISIFLGIYYLGSKTDLKLWGRVIIALVLGVIIGFIFGDLAETSKWIGDLFVRLIYTDCPFRSGDIRVFPPPLFDDRR